MSLRVNGVLVGLLSAAVIFAPLPASPVPSIGSERGSAAEFDARAAGFPVANIGESDLEARRAVALSGAMLPSAAARITAASAWGRLPLSFEETEAEDAFVARGPGYRMLLTSAAATLSLQRGRPSAPTDVLSASEPVVTPLRTRSVVLMQLLGADPDAKATPLEELPGKVHYFIGNDPSAWRTNVRTYARVRFSQVYPGIDVVFYGNQGQLEFDLVVAPGMRPAPVALRFDGADAIRLDAEGNLVLAVEGAELQLRRPVAYQKDADGSRQVDVTYVFTGSDTVELHLGDYDTSRELIIDPVLIYSSYLGGTGAEAARGIAVDSTGVYIGGLTDGTGFPTTGGQSAGGSRDAFVAKLNPSGSALIYAVFLGGSGNEEINDVAPDTVGQAYVTGRTESANFPTTTGAFQTASGGLNDAFVARLGATGTLAYSTYFGGSGNDLGTGVAVHTTGQATVTGDTGSSNLPANAIQLSPAGGGDAFVARFNTNLSGAASRIFSAYLGGSGQENAHGIRVDAAGNIYVTGRTNSTNFPTTSTALQPTLGEETDTASGFFDAYLTKIGFDSIEQVFLISYSTYFGGSRYDEGFDVTVDGSGNMYLVGNTASFDTPSTNGFDTTYNLGLDAFLAKLNPAGSAVLYGTYFGGSGHDEGRSVAVETGGIAYLVGTTDSSNLPANAIQTTYGGPVPTSGFFFGDAFVAKFNTTLAGSASRIYSTYLGGSGLDEAHDVETDGAGSVYVAGETTSTNFPTKNPLQATNAGAQDAFISRIGPGADVSVTIRDSPDPITTMNLLVLTASVHNAGPDPATNVQLVYTLPNNTNFVTVLPTIGTVCSGVTTITCNLGTMAAQILKPVFFVVRPAGTGALTNTMTVSAAEFDPDTSNNAATSTTTVQTGGTVWSWGQNGQGQLGDGSTSSKTQPVSTGLGSITGVSAGRVHSLAVRGDGVVFSWGTGAAGQLGQGPVTFSSSPTAVSLAACPGPAVAASPAVQVAAGGFHSLALLANGTVCAWGQNSHGQLGDGTTSDRFTPVPVSISDVMAIAAGDLHSLAVKKDGTVWTWGEGAFGQLGNGGTADSSTPVQVTLPFFVVEVSGGFQHSLARETFGVVWAWGQNSGGQLGIGTTTGDQVGSTVHRTPVQVGLGCCAISIAAGATHSLAIKSVLMGGNSGTAFAWGHNGNGQLGNGTTTQSTTPGPVSSTSSNWIDVAAPAAGHHSLARQADGSIWAWGLNSSGQLGDGTTGTTRTTPFQLPSLTGVVGIAAGTEHSLAIETHVQITAQVFHDLKGNGQLDAGDPLLNADAIKLFRVEGTTETLVATALNSSLVLVKGIEAGTFKLVETDPPGFISTNAIPGTAGGVKIDNNTLSFTLFPGQTSDGNIFLDHDNVAPAPPTVDIVPTYVNSANVTAVTVSITGEVGATVAGTITSTPGASAGAAPTSVDLRMSVNAGFAGQLDTEDQFKVVFSEVMDTSTTTGDVMKLQDGDGTKMNLRCDFVAGATTANAGDYRASCSFNTLSETVGGVAYAPGRVLTVHIRITALPTIALDQGTTTGVQLPVTVTGQDGFTDPEGNQWNLAGSADQVIDNESPVTFTGTIPNTGTLFLTLDLSGLADGTVNASATLTDAAGNTSAAGIDTAIKDTVAPAAPGQPCIPPPDAEDCKTTNNPQPTFTGSGAEAGGTVRVYSSIHGLLCQTLAAPDGTYTCTSTTALSEGNHIFWANVTDVAGNTGPNSSDPTCDTCGPGGGGTGTIDTTPPTTVSMTAPTDGTSTSDTTPTLTASASDNVGGSGVKNVQFQLRSQTGTAADGSPIFSDWLQVGTLDGTSPYSRTTSTLAQGTHQARAIATDNAGNATTSAAVTFIVDTTAGVSTITFPANGASYNAAGWNGGCGTATGDVCGTATDGSGGSGIQRIDVSVRRNSDGTYWNGTAFSGTTETFLTATGTTSWSLAFALPGDGAYTVHARAVDNANNVEASPVATFTIDTLAPDTTITGTPASPSGSTASFSFTSNEANVSFECALDAGAFLLCSSPKTYTGLAVGSHTLQVRAKDPATNHDASPASHTWNVDQDSDRDGLLDSWEIAGGVTVAGVFVALPDADPNQPDVFVHIDWMGDSCSSTRHKLSAGAIETVVDAFAASPFSNPSPTPTRATGINLHVDQGPDSWRFSYSTTGATPTTQWGSLSKAAQVAHDDVLGTFPTAGTYDWTEFDAVKNRANGYTASKRNGLYRLFVSGHQYGSSANTSSGIARGTAGGQGGDQAIISLGRFSPQQSCAGANHGVGTANDQAGAFMHELGHLLGLDHGGNQKANHKPNYLSVMSYKYWNTGVIRNVSGTLTEGFFDYSRVALVQLNEEPTAVEPLDESVGLGTAAAGFGIRYSCAGIPVLAAADGPIDWNCSLWPNSGTLTPELITTTTTDINEDGKFNTDADCVTPGPNEQLDSAPAGDDQRYGIKIRDGDNKVCDTAPGGDDVRRANPATPLSVRLAGFNDWANLKLIAGSIGQLGFVPTPPTVEVIDHPEPTVEEANANLRVLPDSQMDVDPSSDPNVIGNRPIAVRFFSTPASATAPAFDATQIVLRSLRFGPGGARALLIGVLFGDFNNDGLTDIQVVFDRNATELKVGDTRACARGNTQSGSATGGSAVGTSFVVCNDVVIRGAR